MEKIKILLFASNPEGTTPLKLDEEVRSIDAKIESSKYGEGLELISRWAVRPDDLLQQLNRHKPAIVHFSGHGNQQGEIVLMDKDRQVKPVSAAALKSLFTTLKDNISVVVLNACYSQVQATAIAEVIDCVVGMSVDIGDEAAITFAASFYRAIGFGESVQDAFDQGKTALMLEGIPEEMTPQLLVRKGADASKLILITEVDSKQQAFHSSGSNIEVGKIEAGNIDGNFIVGNNNVIHLSPKEQAFRSLHQLPQPPADFTGRDELIAQILADFAKGKGATIAGLTGMGGIGKTALGLVVAHQLKKDYPDAQIFLDLKGTTEPLSALDVMRHVILSFEPAADLRNLDETGMSTAYQSVLHGKHALLFLDNARSAEQVAPLRPPETCALLVTSRWTFGVPGLKNRHVGVISQENAGKFLLELCPRIGDQADELAKACAYLPLALRIAGSFLQLNSDWRVDKYLAQLNDDKQRLVTLKQSRADAELTTEPDLLATFELSYHSLSKENQKLWRMLGVFPGSFDMSAALAMWRSGLGSASKKIFSFLRGGKPPDYEDAVSKVLGLLLRYSLLDYDETSSRYSLHDLLADYALSQMQNEEEYEARRKHASYYKDVLATANALYYKGGENVLPGLRSFDLEWENIRTGQAWVSQNSHDKNCLELCNEYPDAGYMILSLRLHPRESIAWLEKGLAAARKLGKKGYEGYHLGSLGNVYADLGEARKAIEFQEQCLAIAREIGDRRGEGIALGNLGSAYYSLGEVRKAIELYEGDLAIAREIGDRHGEGTVLGNLGSVYADLGDARKAIEFQEGRLAIVREIGHRHGEGQALGNLGNVYADLGDARKAIDFYEQALAIVREIGDRHGEGQALGNLGVAYKNLGETRKAIEFYERDLAIAREIGDRRGEGATLGNLGLAYADLGDARKAIDFQEQRLAIVGEIGDRLGEGQALNNLGVAYVALGETRKAIEFYEGALVIHREIGDRRSEGNALRNLGNAYYSLGDVHKAIEFYEQDLVIAREIGDRLGEGQALGNLGVAYWNLEEVRKSINFIEESLLIAREIGDRQAEAFGNRNVSEAYEKIGELNKAIEAMQICVDVDREIEHPDLEKDTARLEELRKKLTNQDKGGLT